MCCVVWDVGGGYHFPLSDLAIVCYAHSVHAVECNVVSMQVMQGRVGRLPQLYSTHLQSIVDSLLVTKVSRMCI